MTAASVQERYEVRSADGFPIPVWRSGYGRPVVLVHGASANHKTWEWVRPHLERHFTVLAIDRRSGLVDPSIHYDLGREFEDVAAVANDVGGEINVVGQSSGAICALGAATSISNLRRLVLYEPPYLSATESNTKEMERLLRSGDTEGAAECFLRKSVKLSEETLAAIKAAPGWAEVISRAPFLLREEIVLRAWRPKLEDFAALRAPTLFLTGELTPAEHHHRGFVCPLESAGLNMTLAEIPEQEHGAHTQAPELFARMVSDFLEEQQT